MLLMSSIQVNEEEEFDCQGGEKRLPVSPESQEVDCPHTSKNLQTGRNQKDTEYVAKKIICQFLPIFKLYSVCSKNTYRKYQNMVQQ